MNAIAKLGERTGRALMRCKPVAKVVAKASKNKPEILAVSGGIMIVAAFGWAIYEAVGLKDTLVETSDTVKAVEDSYQAELNKELSDEQRNDIEKEYKKELTKARFKGVMKVGKKFVLPTATLIVGMGLGTKGFKVLRARNVVLGTALKGTQEAYKFYRENVREDLGKEADMKYARGIIGEKEIEETITDENGKEKKVKAKIPVIKGVTENPWRFEYSDTWFRSFKDSSDSNIFFVKCEQDWWNHEMDRAGDAGVSMYEVLKHLGYKFEVLRDGMTPKQFKERMNFLRCYGWKKGSKGDGFIDFGLYRAINEPAIQRKSDVLWLEMNCDGPLDEI